MIFAIAIGMGSVFILFSESVGASLLGVIVMILGGFVSGVFQRAVDKKRPRARRKEARRS